MLLDALSVAPSRPPVPEWGSDVIAELLRRLGVEYAALNPGASFRGIHDSLVNYNANQRPGVILCNHEEVAVAIAHGYAKVRGRAMAAIVHSNVGLMHATMGVFNAWVDRAPVLVLGATGPMDSTRRRPWIDWIHTSHAQGELVRDFSKWDHQPSSIAAIPEAMLRAWQVVHTEPRGPVYLCFDAGLQEQQLDPLQPVALPDIGRYSLPEPIPPPDAAIAQTARWLVEAEFPVILAGSVADAWDDLVALAELLGAPVATDAKSPASFPSAHPLCRPGGRSRTGDDVSDVLRQADVVLALERVDPTGTLRAAGYEPPRQAGPPSWPRVINISMQPYAVRSWAADYEELPAADLTITADAAVSVTALRHAVDRLVTDQPAAAGRAQARLLRHRAEREQLEAAWAETARRRYAEQPISITRLAIELNDAVGDRQPETILAKAPNSWPHGIWDCSRPGSFLGGDGGAGLGSGPGLSVGAALGARGSGQPVLSVLGDGDTLMAPSALWTAAHHSLPLLIVVANNQSYFNDEEHQERVARARSRPVENRWIGQRMDHPAVDFAGLARTLGVEGFGPVSAPAELGSELAAALAAVDAGRPALVDVRIKPR
jgi:thiamine pyrophosphate-dependent acetolactate synthase large subunit-like protein